MSLTPHDTGEEPNRTIRVPDAHIRALLDQLDAEPVPAGARSKRRAKRFPYRLSRCVVHLQQPGALRFTPYVVKTRNISAGGMAFLHGGYVHVGTSCIVQLIRADGHWSDIPGRVVQCRYLRRGSLHEVGVLFDEPITPAAFASPNMRLSALLAMTDRSTALPVRANLVRIHVDVAVALSAEQLVEQTAVARHDAVLLDVDLRPDGAAHAARRLREGGYGGTIVALVPAGRTADAEACAAAGCDACLARPPALGELAALFSALRRGKLSEQPARRASSEAPPAQPDAAPADDLAGRATALREACAAGDRERLAALAASIRDVSTGGGGASLHETAVRLEAALTEQQELSAVTALVEELARLCAPPDPAGPPTGAAPASATPSEPPGSEPGPEAPQ